MSSSPTGKKNGGDFSAEHSLCCMLGCLYAVPRLWLSLETYNNHSLLGLYFPVVPPLSLQLLHQQLLLHEHFPPPSYSFPLSLSLSLYIPPYVSYHLPSSFAGLLRSALWSQRNVLSSLPVKLSHVTRVYGHAEAGVLM